MKRSVWIAVSLLLAAILTLSIVRPHPMLSPGNLIPAHAALQDDCFACHAPLRGASAQRCIGCHAIADIGLRTTKGAAIARAAKRPAFHQALIEPNCIACHSDHAGVRPAGANAVRFDHALLRADARSRCQTCHKAPDDTLHRGQNLPCATCHRLPKWKPATFAHDKYFRLDRAHNVSCAICHPGGNFKRYTCYGCHEHDPARVLAEHREEGIRNIDNCVRCHRSPDEDGGERGEGRGGDDD
ncbi:MAG: cytochrome c3 family protein [Novosphingobium sp.]|uniref:cytochrome c3 family protein n=1 Tax=Novosphingobium sp. TaxID=1874826 RepID=UPI0032B882B8